MRIRKKHGAMALFFCLVLSASLLVLSLLLQAARMCADENDLRRAMSAQIRTILAGYDRTWREFGLFGYRAEQADTTVFSACLPKHMKKCPIRFDWQNPLSDSKTVERQIIRYMKARLPAVYLQLLGSRLTGYQNSIPCVKSAESVKNIKTTSAGGLMAIFQPVLDGLQENVLREAATGLFGGILGDLKNQAMLQLQETYRHYATDILGVKSEDSIMGLIGTAPDFLDPASISNLTGQLDQLVNFETIPIYERCCLVEYVLGQFRPSIQLMRQSTGIVSLGTIAGRSFESFPDERQAEVEQIMTGQEDPDQARRITRIYITSVRSLIHLAAIISSPNQMKALKTTGIAISAAIAAISCGTIMIPPDIMAYILAAGEAIGNGMKDYQKLTDGWPVNFWPDKNKSNLCLYYQDYLRLGLFILPESTVLKRTSIMLGKILPGPCYTGIQIKTSFHQQEYQLQQEYQNN